MFILLICWLSLWKFVCVMSLFILVCEWCCIIQVDLLWWLFSVWVMNLSCGCYGCFVQMRQLFGGMVCVSLCSECLISVFLLNSLYRFDMIVSVGCGLSVVSDVLLNVLLCLKCVIGLRLCCVISMCLVLMFGGLQLCSVMLLGVVLLCLVVIVIVLSMQCLWLVVMLMICIGELCLCRWLIVVLISFCRCILCWWMLIQLGELRYVWLISVLMLSCFCVWLWYMQLSVEFELKLSCSLSVMLFDSVLLVFRLVCVSVQYVCVNMLVGGWLSVVYLLWNVLCWLVLMSDMCGFGVLNLCSMNVCSGVSVCVWLCLLSVL